MDDLCVGNHNLWRNHIGVTTTSRGRTIRPHHGLRKGLHPARRDGDRPPDRPVCQPWRADDTFALRPANAHSGEVVEPANTRDSHPESHLDSHGDTPAGSGPSAAGDQETPSGLVRFAARAPWRKLPHPLRWLTVATIGGTFVVAGVAMLVLPGPGIAFILLGLAILATEFVWAETLLHRVKNGSQNAWRAAKSRIKRDSDPSGSPLDGSRPIAAPQSE